MEKGVVTLVGATTENPSFALNAALLSRAQVLILHRLSAEALATLLARAEEAEGVPLPLTGAAREALVASADGDGRFLLNQVETLYGARLFARVGKDQSIQSRPVDRSEAHRAGLATAIDRSARQREGTHSFAGAADRHHLSVRGGVVGGRDLVPSLGDDLAISDDHGSKRPAEIGAHAFAR